VNTQVGTNVSKDSEIRRLKSVASALRSRANAVEKEVATRCIEGIKHVLQSSGAPASALDRVNDDQLVVNTIAQLREIFLTFDSSHDNKMGVDDFKKACDWFSVKTTDSKLQSSFRKLDTDNDGYISEEELIRYLLKTTRLTQGNIDLDRYTPSSQIDDLLRHVRNVSDNNRGSGDLAKENERLRAENQRMQADMDRLREETQLRLKNMQQLAPQGLETDIERVESLISEMVFAKESANKTENDNVERELARLREFGSAMRNQVNNMQRKLSY